MKKNNNVQYLYTDALLLASIALMSKEKPAELWEIFMAGDHLNHALFSFEEIESGLVRLTKGKWIKELNTNEFSVTDKFKKLNLKISNIIHVSKLAEILETLPWNENCEKLNSMNKLRYPGVDKKVLESASKKYLAK